MGRIFYRYASSTKPRIDRHLINEALDWWSWYWVIVESVAVFAITGTALFFAPAIWLGLVIIGGSVLVSTLFLPFFRSHCARYARREVEEILADEGRKTEVKNEFHALYS